MATNIISQILAESPLKIQSDGQNFAQHIKVSRVILRLSSNPMRHMREDGSTIVDCRIIQPAVISVEAFSPDESTASQISDVLSDRSKLYSVTSRGINVTSAMLENIQIKQVPDVMSAIPIRLNFHQVLTKISQQTVKAQAPDASVVDKGNALLTAATQSVNGLVTKLVGEF